MPEVQWEVHGQSWGNCNCAYGCPCQFNALPTLGFCEGIGAHEVREGRYGDVRLDGLVVIQTIAWPGPIHLGGGRRQLIIDARAAPEQRYALDRIFSGEDVPPGRTVWNVFKLMCDTTFETIFATIDFAMDIRARTARLHVEGFAEGRGEPILNVATGEEHRVMLTMGLNSIEFETAEMGRGWTKTRNRVALDLADSYAQYAEVHVNQDGIIRSR
jgi:hypothetical protein